MGAVPAWRQAAASVVPLANCIPTLPPKVTRCYALFVYSGEAERLRLKDRLPRGGGSGIQPAALHKTGIAEPRLVSAGRTGTGRYVIDATVTSLRFAVIGAGRLGASLALALRERGATMAGFTAASDAGRTRAAGWLGGRAAMRLDELVSSGPELYLLTVPDQALPVVAQELAQALSRAGKPQDPTGQTSRPVAAHTSGATSVSVLAGCEQAGAATLVFHPLQTFSDPATGRARFAGAAVALTPAGGRADSAAGAMGFRLAHALGARPFLLADAKRTLYHAAASVACNYLVTLEHHAHRLFVKAGLPEDEALSLFLPLVSATLENVARQGPIQALTGPLSRGDTHTIQAHIRALGEDAPDLLPLYRSLGLATLDLVKARDEVRGSVLAELAEILRDNAQPEDPGA